MGEHSEGDNFRKSFAKRKKRKRNTKQMTKLKYIGIEIKITELENLNSATHNE